jgi:hypothetical protein
MRREVKRVRKDVNPVSKHTEYFLNIRGGSFITRIYNYSGIDIFITLMSLGVTVHFSNPITEISANTRY